MIDPEIEKIVGRCVSDDVKRTDSRYEIERNKLLADLNDVGLGVIAIHEAAHEHYYRLSGDVSLEFVPPVILFRKGEHNPFKRQLAGIHLESWNPFPEDKEHDSLFKLAKGFVAGGVACSKLTKSKYKGDKTDKPSWNKICTTYYEGETQSEIDSITAEFWLRAKKEVETELTKEDLKSQITARAKEITPHLFPWLNR